MITAAALGHNGIAGVVVALTHADLDELRNGRHISVVIEGGFGLDLLASSDEEGLIARMQEGSDVLIDNRNGR